MQDVPAQLAKLQNACEQFVILPYALTIIDCHFLCEALATLNDHALSAGVQGNLSPREFRSAFDIYAFDRDLDDVEALIFDANSSSFVYWDRDEQFVAVGGSADFCNRAAPYPPSVRKHYFLESTSPPLTEDDVNKLYSALAGEQ